MLEAIKTYKQSVDAMKFIGKKYSSGRDAWTEWREKGFFDSVKNQINIDFMNLYEDGDALIGLMQHEGGDHTKFEYWLGYFTPENTPVPKGLLYVDFPPMDMCICWFYEKDEIHYDFNCEALANIEKEGFIVTTEWVFERYSPNRCDDLMNINKDSDTIMDVGYFIEKVSK